VTTRDAQLLSFTLRDFLDRLLQLTADFCGGLCGLGMCLEIPQYKSGDEDLGNSKNGRVCVTHIAGGMVSGGKRSNALSFRNVSDEGVKVIQLT
jgi:hypothetical protein